MSDLAQGLGQQMIFWGCDARHPDGNFLSRYGMERIAREKRGGEGSSRYRLEWRGGLVELHSYCVGWYSSEALGVIYIRSRGCFQVCIGPVPLTPGKYEIERLMPAGRNLLLQAVKPLLTWILSYEGEVLRSLGSRYREACWKVCHSKVGPRPWLPPEKATAWFAKFLEDPAATPRPRYFELQC